MNGSDAVFAAAAAAAWLADGLPPDLADAAMTHAPFVPPGRALLPGPCPPAAGS